MIYAMQVQKQTRLLAAAMLALSRLHAMGNGATRAEAEALGRCASLLADCEALRYNDNAFLKHCLRRIMLCPIQLFSDGSGASP